MPSSDTIFLNARELEDPAERARYVAESCGTDVALHERVEAMLRAAEAAAEYFAESTPDAHRYVAEHPGLVIGRYELIEKIAEGGMGVVYLAEQREPVRRKVALKIIKLGMDTKAVVARFEAERQALALMDHPNIAKVFDAGVTESGRSYFVMELVNGVPITRYCDENKVSMAERLELFLEVCSAIEHAHQKGVIHRDIKPSNILVTTYGGRRVPKVIDFGIAKATQARLTENTVVTQFQQFVGTPAYMSPEQASLSGMDIDTRSDIYSLGVLLYELLVGRTPFNGDVLCKGGLEEMCRIIREREPERPSTSLAQLEQSALSDTAVRRSIDLPRLIHLLKGDLDWIVLKALEKERERRYDTAGSLAADVRRFLNQEPISARPPSTIYTLKKSILRNRTAFFAGTAVALSLVFGLVLTAWQASARKKALIELRRTLYVAQIQEVQQAWKRGDISKAKTLLREQIPKPGEEDLRGFEWRYLWKLCRDGSALTFSNAFTKQMVSVAVSPDGSLLASGDESGQIELRRTSDWSLLNHSMRHLAGTRSLQFTPDGQSLVTAGDRTVRIWDRTTWQEKASFFFTNRGYVFISCARISPDGSLIAAGNFPGQWVHVWDVHSGDLVASFEGPLGSIRFVDFSPDGTKLAFSNGDSRIYIWDVRTRGEPHKIPTPYTIVAHVKFSPDGRFLASSGADGVIRLWSTDDWKEAGKLHGHDNMIRTMNFSRDGQVLVSGCLSGIIKLWDIATQTELQTLYGHSILVEDLAFFPDGKNIASVSSDATMKIWNVPDLKEQVDRSKAFASAHRAVFSPDGRVFATISGDALKERRIWNTESGRLVATLTNLHSESVLGEFSPDSRIFAAPGWSNSVFVWSIPDGRLKAHLSTETNTIETVAFSKEGDLFAAGRGHPTIRRWSAQSFEPKGYLTGYEHGVSEVKISPDGEILAAWCPDGNIRPLEMRSLAPLPPIPHASEGSAMSFSLDGKLLCVGSSRGTELWEIRSVKQLSYLEGGATAFSPDGRFLAICPQNQFEGTVEQQNSVLLWDLKRSREAARLPWTSGWVFSLTYSPDGRTLISCDNWRTVRLFSMRLGREVLTLPSNGGGNTIFSPDGNALLILDNHGENQILRASSFAEVEKELAAESGLTKGNL